jgi:hypothetical protein
MGFTTRLPYSLRAARSLLGRLSVRVEAPFLFDDDTLALGAIRVCRTQRVDADSRNSRAITHWSISYRSNEKKRARHGRSRPAADRCTEDRTVQPDLERFVAEAYGRHNGRVVG